MRIQPFLALQVCIEHVPVRFGFLFGINTDDQMLSPKQYSV